MSARDEILAAVRRSLHVTGEEAPRRAAVEARLAQAPAGIIPERGQGEAGERAATFKAEAALAQASLAEVAAAADVPAEVARYLRENNLPALPAHGRGRAPRRDALGRDRARNFARTLRRE